MADSQSLFATLKSRRINRGAIAHVIVAWLFVQVADVVLPYLGVVDEPVRWALVIGVGTFPLTLFVAWLSDDGRPVPELLLLVGVAVLAGWWVTGNLPEGARERTSVVVLPFEHDGSEEGLSRALSYEVISLLTRTQAIDVIAYHSANSNALQGLGSIAAAERLSVNSVLQGRVGTRGDTMRVELQLLSAAGEALWEAALEESKSDLAALQERIAIEVERRLAAGDEVVSVKEAAAQRCWMPSEPDALRRYYTARHYTELRSVSEESRQQLAEAIRMFKELIDEYPNFAEAYSGLIWAYGYQQGYHPDDAGGEWFSKREPLANAALEHCPNLGEALHLVANEYDHENRWIGEWQQRTAFAKAEPHKPEYLQQLIMHYRFTGLDERALQAAEKAYALNPLSVRTITRLAGVEQYRGNLDRAIELQQRAAELGLTDGMFAQDMQNMSDCAYEDVDCIVANLPRGIDQFAESLGTIMRVPANEDEQQESLEMAYQLLADKPFLTNWFNGMACNRKNLGELFFHAWDQQDNPGGWFWPNAWGDCDHVHSDPRFAALVEEQGFVEYWQTVDWPDACQPQGESFACGRNIDAQGQ